MSKKEDRKGYIRKKSNSIVTTKDWLNDIQEDKSEELQRHVSHAEIIDELIIREHKRIFGE